MTEYVQVTTTTGTRHDADQIAAELVSRRLAACVQVTGPIASTFRWQGKIENAEEWMCIAKTIKNQLSGIQKLFDEIHPYDVPEVIVMPIVEGSADYLKWLDDQVGKD